MDSGLCHQLCFTDMSSKTKKQNMVNIRNLKAKFGEGDVQINVNILALSKLLTHKTNVCCGVKSNQPKNTLEYE